MSGRTATTEFLTGLGRAAGGSIFFSLPLLMTMEMWHLGFYIGRLPLALLMIAVFPLLVALDRLSGFKDTTTWIQDALDAAVAYGVGIITSALVLALLGIIDTTMTIGEVAGKVALQSVPASFGAVLAASQLSGDAPAQDRARMSGGYGTEMLLMVAGAVFFAFNVAPTEEMLLIAYRITPWHAIALVIATIAAMHAFVYAVNFGGSARLPRGVRVWSLVIRFALPGYVISLVVSAYVLWTFGRFESHAMAAMLKEAVVLGFPAGLGAAAARLVI